MIARLALNFGAHLAAGVAVGLLAACAAKATLSRKGRVPQPGSTPEDVSVTGGGSAMENGGADI